MASRDDIVTLMGRLAEMHRQLAAALATQRPGDAEARELVANTIAQLGEELGEHLDTATITRPDLGEAARIGLGRVAPDLGLAVIRGLRATRPRCARQGLARFGSSPGRPTA